MSKNLLIIFTRNPELGKVKTRLSKSIGDENALSIYKTLLKRTEKNVRDLNCDKTVYYSVKIRENDIWDDSIYQKHQQHGLDLGERMQNAFINAFNKKYEKVAIIGSDLFDLNQNHINEAFKSLNKKDFVIGPAHDGGYYLLGMKSLNSHVFKNKDWGTSSVLRDTLADLKGKSVYLLETLNDIDVYDDLINIRAFKKYLI
ncbi:MAG: glycosyltransferase [Flavobacteriaceae bacterium]|nr:TIGR04282 family arsenosugar biosynthesis glycosyltransferase [Bacteroidia bacterium]NNL15918.1 glycosyltransferase [Flavobacteriaceae bacterium]